MITFCVFFKNVNSLRSQNYSGWPESGAITTNVTFWPVMFEREVSDSKFLCGICGSRWLYLYEPRPFTLGKIDCNQVNTPRFTLSRYEGSSPEPVFGLSILGCCRNMVTPSVDINVSFWDHQNQKYFKNSFKFKQNWFFFKDFLSLAVNTPIESDVFDLKLFIGKGKDLLNYITFYIFIISVLKFIYLIGWLYFQCWVFLNRLLSDKFCSSRGRKWTVTDFRVAEEEAARCPGSDINVDPRHASRC